MKRRTYAYVWWALLSAVALLLAACSGGDGPGRAGQRPTGAAPTDAGSSSAPRIPSGTGLPGWSHSVGFAADGSGFTLLATCPEDDARPEEGCTQDVAVLDKGASSWRLAAESPIPGTRPPDGVTAGLIVLGPGRALITEGLRSEGDRTWFTRDGGRTWKEGRAEPAGTIASVPKGAPLLDDCVRMDREGNGCERSRLVTVLPDTGQYRALAHQPALKGWRRPAGEPAENMLCASGTDPKSGLPTLATSEDRGRTWHVGHMTGPAKDGWGFSVVAGRGGTYAVQSGGLPLAEKVKNGLLAIHASSDGGYTWTRVWEYRKGVEPLSVLGAPVAALDHSLTVYGEHGVWRSTDGARGFTRVEGTEGPSGSVEPTPIGYLWSSSFGQGSYRISADGTHWHAFELGGPS
ncbi:exo-alpha-sialidase [Streptomyces sp. NBC_01304]|uniref:exo-alpha-sialidase n=1 Tax=Streptomyces sp. NBC_01304 TaxID=2903818 RepID=UPI002E0D9E97|nr:exo-alpha-sialidase [Streptomyces sp. NBC_01304]